VVESAHLVVLQRDGADPDIVGSAVLECLENILEDAEFRRKELAGSAPGPFDEALDCERSASAQSNRSAAGEKRRTVLAVLKQLLDVLLHDRRVQRVVAERAPDEHGTALGECRADDGHVEVLAGNDVGEGKAEAEEEPGNGCARVRVSSSYGSGVDEGGVLR
jgi:hypothetical protein